jgi:hypothetical protein
MLGFRLRNLGGKYFRIRWRFFGLERWGIHSDGEVALVIW